MSLAEEEKQIRKIDKIMASRFGAHIKQNFLLEMEHKILTYYKEEIRNMFKAPTEEDLLCGTIDPIPQYEICRLVVGIHSTNTMFLPNDERVKMERDEEYKSKLRDEVYKRLMIRIFSGCLTRNQAFISSEDFIYYPAAYDLLAMTTALNNYLCEKINNEYWPMFTPIITKSLGALFLLEDGIFESAYPVCRGMIESFIKHLAIFSDQKTGADAYNYYIYLNTIEIKKNQCDIDYDNEFLKKYENRINKCKCSVSNYVHFGWVDKINNYHDCVKNNPYSIKGLIAYLISFNKNEATGYLRELEYYYGHCHAYAHANISTSIYSLVHYYEICKMISLVIPVLFKTFVDTYKMDKLVDGIDLLKMVEEDIITLNKKRSKMTTETLEQFYSFKKRSLKLNH